MNPRNFAILLLAVTCSLVHANPLAKFLMMNKRDAQQKQAPVSPPNPAPNATPENESSDDEACVPTETFQSVQEQLSDAADAKAAAEAKQAEANALAEKLQEEHEGYKRETESQLEDLSKTTESAQKMVRVQEDFAARIAKMQQQAEADLAAAKATIVEKEKEIELLKSENMQRISEAEAEWKAELNNAESAKTEVVIQIQAEYEERVRELEEQAAVLLDEKKSLQENYDKLNVRVGTLVKNQDIALQAYLEVNLDRETAKATKAVRDSYEDEIEELKRSSKLTIDALTAELEMLKESSTATIQQWESDYASLKEASEKTIAKLTADYASLQESNQKFVDDMKRNHEQALESLKQKQASDWEKEHNHAMSALKEQVRSFEEDKVVLVNTLDTTQRELRETQATYQQAQQDADYWEEKFTTRSYVNLTHVAEGVGALPAYDEHVAPRVEKARTAVEESAQTAFDGMTQQFQKRCPTAVSALRRLEKFTGISLPRKIYQGTEYSCQHADEAVLLCLKIVLFLVLFLLRFQVWFLMVPLVNVILSASHFLFIDPFHRLVHGNGVVRAPGGGFLSGTGGTPPKKPQAQ